MGKQLAQMHKSLSPNGLYGFDHDNYIGSSPQSNQWTESWCDFYLNHRLLPQIQLFELNGHYAEEKDLLLQKARERLSSHHPSPSLLHGFALLFRTMVETCGEATLASFVHPHPSFSILQRTMGIGKRISS